MLLERDETGEDSMVVWFKHSQSIFEKTIPIRYEKVPVNSKWNIARNFGKLICHSVVPIYDRLFD